MKRTLATLVAALCTTGLLAACGDDDGDPSSGGETTAETTSPEEGAGDDGPGRIVSMSASATEMLFAIGAGDQVVAADSFSNYPAEAPTTDLSAYEPNIEAISAHDPDLVVVYATDPHLVARLDALGIEVLDAPAAQTLDAPSDRKSN